jgi:hypothetical protein
MRRCLDGEGMWAGNAMKREMAFYSLFPSIPGYGFPKFVEANSLMAGYMMKRSHATSHDLMDCKISLKLQSHRVSSKKYDNFDIPPLSATSTAPGSPLNPS